MSDAPSIRSCDKGFTLLEVVISLGLITVALLSVFHLQASNIMLQSDSRFTTVAGQLLQDRLSYVSASPTLVEGAFSGDFGEEFPGFRYSGKISGTSMGNVYRISMGIYSDGDLPQARLSTETFIYRPGR